MNPPNTDPMAAPVDEPKIKHCKNCDHPLVKSDKFCSQCGQKAKTKRLTMSDIRKTVLQRLLHHDQGIVLLTRDLALQPGKTILDYFKGKRKKYYDPFKYLLLSVGISVLVVHTFDIMKGGVNQNNPVSAFADKHFNLIMLASVPVCAFFSWLLFRKYHYNFAEHLSMHAFLGGFRTVFFLVLFAPMVVLLPQHYYAILMVYLVVRLLYLVWTYLQIFKNSLVWTCFKTVLLFVFTEITMIVLLLTIFMIFYPDSLRILKG